MARSMQDAIKKDMFKAEVQWWARRIGVEVNEIHIRHMRRKWASVSRRGRVTFNVDLLDQPSSFQREVIVHELVHLKLGNGSHGKLFRSLLRAYLSETDK